MIALFWACHKDEEQPTTSTSTSPPVTTTVTSCNTNSGSFNINMGGTNHTMVVNNQSQFTILYNWYNEAVSAFIINSINQNNEQIYIELGLPGTFNEGTTTYSNSNLDFDFFNIDLDTLGYYVSEVTFNVTQSSLDTQDGIYKPVVATFSGTAHSYPWTNGQPPIDTLSFTGDFCLNGIILQ